MQFTTLPLLALVAAVSAQNGSWNVTRSYKPVSQQVSNYDLTAVFISDAYPFPGLESKCSWIQKDTPQNIECTPSSYSLEAQDDGTFKMQQVLDKPTKQTVYGQGEIPSNGHVVIDVYAAVA